METYLKSLDGKRFGDTIPKLEAYENQFTIGQVRSATVVLLNLLPEIPEMPTNLQGMFDFDNRFAVKRLVYRLVRSLKNQDEIERVVREILPQISSLSSKMEIIGIVGHRENRGHQLVSESAAIEFEKQWRAEVRSVGPEFLLKETELLRILLEVKREADPSEPHLPVTDSPSMTLSLLKSSRSEDRSQSVGSRVVQRSPRLAWDALIEVYGNENVLHARLESLMALPSKDSEELLLLAGKYLQGWRPEE